MSRNPNPYREDLLIRPATPDDAPLAAELLEATMGGVCAYTFGLGERERGLFALRRYFMAPGTRLSSQFSHVAEWAGQAAGLLLSFPGGLIGRLESALAIPTFRMYGLWGALRLGWRSRSIALHKEAGDDEYYISNLAVVASRRGKGIGRALLEFAESQARAAGLKKCALMVEMNNMAARSLYESLGYRVVALHLTPALVNHGSAGMERRVKVL